MEPLLTRYVLNSRFDMCSDALQVVCDLLRRNKQMVANTLLSEVALCDKVRLHDLFHVQIFSWLRSMIRNGNYVVTRVASHVLLCLCAEM